MSAGRVAKATGLQTRARQSWTHMSSATMFKESNELGIG